MFIIGYMASGKTTFGRALARRLGWEFIDLDFYIEQRYRKSINQIFDESGQDEFRRIEAAMLREVGEFENVIISCGGGTPCFMENMDYMLSRSEVVWLETSEECIVRRLLINNSRRPLMRGKSEEQIRHDVSEGLRQRLPFYSRASIHFRGENLEDRRQISQSVENFLNSHRNQTSI